MDQVRLNAMLQRAQHGEAEAFAELYRHCSARVFGLCRKLLGSVEAAQDATTEVFLRAKRSLGGFDRQKPFHPWLLRIASHYCCDEIRRRARNRELFVPAELEDAADPGDDPLSMMLDAEARQRVQIAIETMPERFRVPLVLRYYGEQSYREIGDAMGLSHGDVAVLLFRARAQLRRRLQDPGVQT